MIRAEQVPKEAITKMMKSVHWSSFYGEDDARELIAAALNAWPGMVTNYSWDASHGRIILPLTENSNERE